MAQENLENEELMGEPVITEESELDLGLEDVETSQTLAEIEEALKRMGRFVSKYKKI